MILQSKLMEDLKAAMKNKEKARKAAITVLKSKLALAEKESINKTGEGISPEQEYAIVNKECKLMKDVLVEFVKGNRQDSIDEANIQIELLEEYVKIMSEHVELFDEDKIKEMINKILNDIGITEPNMRHMGKVMSKLMPDVKGKIDGKIVNDLVRQALK